MGNNGAVILAAMVAAGVLVMILVGWIQAGYMTRVWRRSSRLGRGRRYRDE